MEWTEWDLNPRLPPCEGGDLPLIYRPANLLEPRHRQISFCRVRATKTQKETVDKD